MDKPTIRRVGVFVRPNSPHLKPQYLALKKRFADFNIEVNLDSDSGKSFDEVGIDSDELIDISDILISLGGDGTLLSTARKSFRNRKPIFPIYAGHLGFLVVQNIDMALNFVENIVTGHYRLEKRKLLKIEFQEREEQYALNEVLITHKQRMKMSFIQVYRDRCSKKENLLNNYYGDGLIISTPTGSTAYNLSSGGPILYPEMASYILTPMAPHSLTQRPIVLPSKVKICATLPDTPGLISIDGQNIYRLEKGEPVKISIHHKPIEIIRGEVYNFFDSLREKLKWGGDIEDE